MSRICDEFNVPADYMLGRTNTVAVKEKKKDECELTGISDAAADFLFGLVNHQRYGEINKLNYLLEDLANDYNEDYDMQGDRNLESASSIFNAVFSYMEKFRAMKTRSTL